MIGIDTNVVVRLLLRDDEEMFGRAANLISRTSPEDPLIVNAVVVAESLWVLERTVRLERQRARSVLLGFLESDEIRVHETNPLRNWTDMLMQRHRDFSDLIIAQINREIGCDFTYTLDEAAARVVPGMKHLA